MRGNVAQQFPVRWAAIVVLCLTGTDLSERDSAVCRADEPASAAKTRSADTTASPLVTTESGASADPAETAEQAVAEREHKAQIREELRRGFAILLVLVLLAVFVMMMFLLWGIRLRRRLRKPLPAIHKGDELWFLKPATQKPDDNPPEMPPTNPNGG
ncbi:MAG: hypothetical protein HZA46_04575 [Planctomycetales bacterium]|nr:hypothetical protein [Planctomycetales bacterium]